jgi:DNA-binding MarR family transcriptional regulator
MNTRSGGRAGPVPYSRPAQSRVAYLVGRLDRVLRQQLGTVTAQFGLTVAQYTALTVLKARGPLSNAKLARRALITPQAMNELIKAMEVKGLVTRRPDPDHGRVVHMLLTSAGEALVLKCDRATLQVEDRMLQQLSAVGLEQLRSGLWSCIAALEP